MKKKSDVELTEVMPMDIFWKERYRSLVAAKREWDSKRVRPPDEWMEEASWILERLNRASELKNPGKKE